MMESPKTLFKDYIVKPVYRFYKNYISNNAIHNACGKIANFIFTYSKETSLIMLIFNSVSIISSHISQINGLRKSKRENKDYLMTQEKKELGLDLILTVIPPFLINNALKKKLESGALTTKEAQTKLINVAAPVVGASKDDLYRIDHIRPLKETVVSLLVKLNTAILKKKKKLPVKLENSIRNINRHLKPMLPNMTEKMPTVTLEDIATDFDDIAKDKLNKFASKNLVSKKILKKFRNGSAYDDLCGQNNGLLIIATLGYTIIASNIIMPILKNKLANREYEKQLARMGETRESIKRKKRFEYCKNPIINPFDSNTFSVFDNYNESKTNKISPHNNNQDKNLFNEFNKYTGISSQPIGLRI